MLHDKWLTARLGYLRSLKAPSYQQRLLLALADKLGRTAADARVPTALISAEATTERAHRELYKTSELLILAGLVDSATGSPVFDRGELLGALLGLAKVPIEDARRSEWKSAGKALLAEKAK
jgi:hypothetical protein